MFKFTASVLAAAVAVQGALSAVQSEDLIQTHFNQLVSDFKYELTASEKVEFFNNFKTLVLEGSNSDFNRLFESARPAILEAQVAEINAKATSWKASKNSRFANLNFADAKDLMGFISHAAEDIPTSEPLTHIGDNLPVNFNSIEAFPECANVIGHIRDQSKCGSCWAFASTESFNDRLCIASKGDFQTLLSPQHTASCCNVMKCVSFGCSGGMPARAWAWFAHEGVVTGGDYKDQDTCWPYEIRPCRGSEHSTDPECEGKFKTPVCRKSCLNENYPVPFAEDRHKAKNHYTIHRVAEIKKQILANGPVSAGFTVMDDFIAYEDGVYVPTSTKQLGGHAIKIVGWGYDEATGLNYWLCANSWSATWGLKGFFKIKMGVVGINDSVVAGDVLPPTSELKSVLRF